MAQACRADGAGVCCGPPRDAANRGVWLRIAAGAFIAANTMTVDLAMNTAEASPATRLSAHVVVLILTLATLSLLGWPLARASWQALRQRRVSLEAMFVAGIVGAFTASVLATVTGEGPVYFEIVSILLVVYALGQQISRVAEDRAVRAAVSWAPELDTCQVVTPEGTVETIPAASLRPGQVIQVYPGRTIPADGDVIDGVGFVREAAMTGEHFAVVRRPGDRVWAGTHVVDATFRIRAAVPGTERRIDRIVDAVERARSVPATLQRQADQVIRWLLPGVLAVAAATFASWTLRLGWHAGLFNSMAVLLVACPCALGLATPLAVWVAIGRLAGRGLVVRGGDAVERLAAVDTAVFDKTGTLTESRAALVDLVVSPGSSLAGAELRRLLAAVEGTSQHPLAAAFVAEAGGEGSYEVEDVRLLPGAGLEALVRLSAGGRKLRVAVGTPARLLETKEQAREEAKLHRRLLPQAMGQEIVVLVDGRVVAEALVAERLRRTWPAALASITHLGLRAVVMTGDAIERTTQVEATEVFARLTPEEKAAKVERLKREGRKVLYVGDGVNDAAAMAASHVSVAAAAGSELAVEVADVTWHGGDLRAIPWAVETCRESVRTIRSNLAFAAAYNLVGVALAAGGVLHPVVAAVLMTCSSLIVTWRAAGREWEGSETAPASAPSPVATLEGAPS